MKNIVFLLFYFILRTAMASCGAPEGQREMDTCAAQEYAAHDKELNEVYSRYRNRLNYSQKRQLKDAQTAWIKFRDLSCDFESSAVEGGSAFQMVRHGCLAKKTAIRVQEIMQLNSCREGNVSCPVH